MADPQEAAPRSVRTDLVQWLPYPVFAPCKTPFPVSLAPCTAAGAQCLDGTPPGYHIQHKDHAAWTIHLQGGGWCTSPEDCLGRSKGALGSSKSFESDMDSILGGYDGGAHGIFSSDAAINPRFNNHTKAYIRCASTRSCRTTAHRHARSVYRSARL